MSDGVRRVDIGFQGGQVLALRLTQESHEGLRKALADERASRWHQLVAQDSTAEIDLSQVIYVRLDTEEHKVGF